MDFENKMAILVEENTRIIDKKRNSYFGRIFQNKRKHSQNNKKGNPIIAKILFLKPVSKAA
jgi:hypothetical protein